MLLLIYHKCHVLRSDGPFHEPEKEDTKKAVKVSEKNEKRTKGSTPPPAKRTRRAASHRYSVGYSFMELLQLLILRFDVPLKQPKQEGVPEFVDRKRKEPSSG